MRSSCLLAFFAVAAAAQQAGAGRGVNFYSLDREIALGRQLSAEFLRNATPLDSPSVQAYVNDLGQRLAAQSGGPAFPYSFTVVKDDFSIMHEPASFPGGFVFVPARLLLAAQGEDEFAGMLAHAIAHVAARHGTRQATRGELVEMATVPLVYVGGWTGYAMQQGAGLAIPLGMLNMARTFELQADTMAIKMMSEAGYSPGALARYIEREQPVEDARPKAFSPLPGKERRLTGIQNAIDALPPRAYVAHLGLAPIQAEVRRLIPAIL